MRDEAEQAPGALEVANTGVILADVPIPAEKLQELTSGLIEV